jgi:hypothetical protein
VRLSADVLDQIEEIVTPGAEVNPDDNAYTAPRAGRQAPAPAAERPGVRRSLALLPGLASLDTQRHVPILRLVRREVSRSESDDPRDA